MSNFWLFLRLLGRNNMKSKVKLTNAQELLDYLKNHWAGDVPMAFENVAIRFEKGIIFVRPSTKNWGKMLGFLGFRYCPVCGSRTVLYYKHGYEDKEAHGCPDKCTTISPEDF